MDADALALLTLALVLACPLTMWLMMRRRHSHKGPGPLAGLLLPVIVLAQQGGMGGESMNMSNGACPMCGVGGWALAAIAAVFVLAATAAMIALAMFLVRRSRPPMEA